MPTIIFAAMLMGSAGPAPGAFSPLQIAQVAMLQALPALQRCTGEVPVRASVRLRVDRRGRSHVVDVAGVADRGARLCLRVVMEGLRFAPSLRVADRELTVPLEFGLVAAPRAGRACGARRHATLSLSELGVCPP